MIDPRPVALGNDGRLDGLAHPVVALQRELADLRDDDDLLLALDDDVLQPAQIELVDLQPLPRRLDDGLGHVGGRGAPIGVAGEEALHPDMAGQIALEDAGDVVGELLGVDQRGRLLPAVQRPPEDLLQRRAARRHGALRHSLSRAASGCA